MEESEKMIIEILKLEIIYLKLYKYIIYESKQSFVLECACNDPDNCPIGDCECAGQVRINHDCTLAK